MNKKRLIQIAKFLVIILIIAAFAQVFYKAYGQYQSMNPKPEIDWLQLLAAGGVYILGLIPPAIFWHCLLKRFNQNPGWGESICAHICGHIGKYVPGKAMVVIIRTAMVQSSRTNIPVAAAAAFLETLTLMAVGAFLACVYLTWHAIQTGDWLLLAGSVVMVLCAGLPTIPAVFVWIVRKIGKNKIAAGLEDIEHLPARVLVFGWGLEILCWLGFAVSYWLTLGAVGVNNLHFLSDLPQMIGVVSFAVSAGFLILVLPGGLGVRDLAFIGLMTPFLEIKMPGSGLAMATIASIVLRLTWLIAECCVAVVLYAVKRSLPNPLQ